MIIRRPGSLTNLIVARAVISACLTAVSFLCLTVVAQSTLTFVFDYHGLFERGPHSSVSHLEMLDSLLHLRRTRNHLCVSRPDRVGPEDCGQFDPGSDRTHHSNRCFRSHVRLRHRQAPLFFFLVKIPPSFGIFVNLFFSKSTGAFALSYFDHQVIIMHSLLVMSISFLVIPYCRTLISIYITAIVNGLSSGFLMNGL